MVHTPGRHTEYPKREKRWVDGWMEIFAVVVDDDDNVVVVVVAGEWESHYS